MPRTLKISNSLHQLLDRSSRPVYAIDGRRRIVYCNAALAAWLELDSERVVGRLVEYHSEPPDGDEAKRSGQAPLADLCPPPRALGGEACTGTISCAARGGRLAHRHANFMPLPVLEAEDRETPRDAGVFVLLDSRDLSPEELATEVATDPSADDLHRAIRRFRRNQADHYAVESLLGDSSAMQKVRAQVAAAALSGANVLVAGVPGSGRGHVARAVHYRGSGEVSTRLMPVDCKVANDESLRRSLEVLRSRADDPKHRPTLLLENLECLEPALQSQLAFVIRQSAFHPRVIATCNSQSPCSRAEVDAAIESENISTTGTANDTQGVTASIECALHDAISTITITVPRLRERLADLPILAQCFLESCNRGSGKQVGSIRADAVDALALHLWPGELDELREAIASAHARTTSHEITPADLPAFVHHAAQAAVRSRPPTERIVLDELLAQIEREAIVRALSQANGNKTDAAALLGMNRPRLYRRLVQLGLIVESPEPELELPEFIERPANDDVQ
jgi:DNA-binding NtrC family response regulator